MQGSPSSYNTRVLHAQVCYTLDKRRVSFCTDSRGCFGLQKHVAHAMTLISMSMPPDCFDRQRLTCPGGPQHGARWHTGLQPRPAASAAARRAPRRQRTAPRAALVHPPPAPLCRPAPSSTAPAGCQLRCLVTSEPCEDCVVHLLHCRAALHTALALVGVREVTISSSQAGFRCISLQQYTPRCPGLSAAVNHWPLSSCPQYNLCCHEWAARAAACGGIPTGEAP